MNETETNEKNLTADDVLDYMGAEEVTSDSEALYSCECDEIPPIDPNDFNNKGKAVIFVVGPHAINRNNMALLLAQ
jgi:hypothetical protein